MLIIKSLILAVSFLTQVAVLAAPIPLDARALSLKDDAIFSRADLSPTGTFVSLACTWLILILTIIDMREQIEQLRMSGEAQILREYLINLGQ